MAPKPKKYFTKVPQTIQGFSATCPIAAFSFTPSRQSVSSDQSDDVVSP
jgi:hypothetical protein